MDIVGIMMDPYKKKARESLCASYIGISTVAIAMTQNKHFRTL
ncbi:hypothetical protein [Clostridium sp.]|nr:hypothetical protein [Clostridium sp.]